MSLDFAIAEIAADAGQIIFSQYMMNIAHRHPLLFDSGSHKGDGRNIERHGTVQRPGIVADKQLALREDGKELSDILLNGYTNRMFEPDQNILDNNAIRGTTQQHNL